METFDPYLPIWLRSDRKPIIETRPDDASSEWPEGAIERISFTQAEYPDFPHKDRYLPGTVFYGADGWPLAMPEATKTVLDPRFKDLLHRCPQWLVAEASAIWDLATSEGWASFLTEWCRIRRTQALLEFLPGPGEFGASYGQEGETDE